MIIEIAVIVKRPAIMIVILRLIILKKLSIATATNMKQAMPKVFLKALILCIR